MKNNPPPFDLTKKGDGLRVQSVTAPGALTGADVIITPKGPRLNLEPIGAQMFVDMPNETEDEIVGGIHLPAGTRLKFDGFRPVKVVAVGPEVKQVKKDDTVLIIRPQVEMIVHDGHQYWRTTETAVVGIIRP